MTRSARPIRQFATVAGRRLLVGLALASYLAAIGGFPLPGVRVAVDLSRPFPCQDHACGCVDADHCWNDCCCHTPAERLAWALAHGVQIPHGSRVIVAVPAPHAPRACCATSTTPKACAENSDAVAQESNTAPAKTTGWVHGQWVRQCRGMTTTWVAAGAVSPLPAPVTLNVAGPAVGWLFTPPPTLTSLSFPPDSPPPRA